ISLPDSTAYLKGNNVWVSGLPIRPEIGTVNQLDGKKSFGLDDNTPVILVFGGSLGAQRLNTLVVEAWKILSEEGTSFQALHITGSKDYERARALYGSLPIKAKIVPYCHSMAHAYAAASILISRAGASTIAELLVVQK